MLPEIDDSVEAWMERNRVRNARALLESKLEAAEKRKFNAVRVPLPVLRSIIKAMGGTP